jgi:hypothetical protein
LGGFQSKRGGRVIPNAPPPDISRYLLRLSLTPGFSPVDKGADEKSRFNGFYAAPIKAAEAAPNELCQWTPG